MNAILLLSSITLLPADGLFAKLDRNQDQRVAADEISDSQRPFFDRALRVGDRDNDGSLTAAELDEALKPSKPVTLPAAGFGGRGSMGGRMNADNLKAMDRNKDGMLSIDEVPQPLRPRFQQMLDQTGKDSIAIDNVARLLSGGAGLRNPNQKPGEPDADEMNRIEDESGSGKMNAKPADDEMQIEPAKPGTQKSAGSSAKSGSPNLRERLKSKMSERSNRKKP